MQNINAITLWLFTTFFLFLLQKCNEHFITMNYIHFIIGDFITPFFIYISMIMVAILMYISKYKKVTFWNTFFRVMARSWWVVVLKLMWNLSNMIIMGGDYAPTNEAAGLFPVFILFSMWIIILFFSMYQIPRIILDSKSPVSFSLFLGYISEAYLKLSFCTIMCFFGSGIILIVLCFIFSPIPYYLSSHFDPLIVKIFIEDILALATQTITGHLLATISFYIYYHADARYHKRIKIMHIE
jgi:hypothetical protein